MGVLNVTPDSFSDGGRFFSIDKAVEQGRRLAAEGADILDVGGESTRPGADAVEATEEIRRVVPVIERLSGVVRISIDTLKPEVARAALQAGATLVNDVTGLNDPRMAEAAAEAGAGVLIMHMRGTPQTMKTLTYYTDLVGELKEYLRERAELARKAGIAEIWLDPGIGFAKTAAQGFEILRRLREFGELGYPVAVGPSRKSFLASLEGMEQVSERLEGTLAAVAIAVLNGARMVRVHDVAACRKACRVAEAVLGLE